MWHETIKEYVVDVKAWLKSVLETSPGLLHSVRSDPNNKDIISEMEAAIASNAGSSKDVEVHWPISAKVKPP